MAVDLGLDTSTPAGELPASVRMTSAALQATKAAGTTLGRPTQGTPAVYRYLVERRDGGATWAQLAQEMNNEQVPPAGRPPLVPVDRAGRLPRAKARGR